MTEQHPYDIRFTYLDKMAMRVHLSDEAKAVYDTLDTNEHEALTRLALNRWTRGETVDDMAQCYEFCAYMMQPELVKGTDYVRNLIAERKRAIAKAGAADSGILGECNVKLVEHLSISRLEAYMKLDPQMRHFVREMALASVSREMGLDKEAREDRAIYHWDENPQFLEACVAKMGTYLKAPHLAEAMKKSLEAAEARDETLGKPRDAARSSWLEVIRNEEALNERAR